MVLGNSVPLVPNKKVLSLGRSMISGSAVEQSERLFHGYAAVLDGAMQYVLRLLFPADSISRVAASNVGGDTEGNALLVPGTSP